MFRRIEDIEAMENKLSTLSIDQINALEAAALELVVDNVVVGCATAITGGTAFCMAVSFFMGGLFGWLLIMKKKILQCDHCSATVAAS